MLGLVRSTLASIWPSMLTGSCVLMTASFAQRNRGHEVVVALVLGAFLGVFVLGLVRLFPVARWAYPLIGVFVGPLLPMAFFARATPRAEVGGLWVVGALFGALIGAIEWARQSRVRERARDAAPGE